MTSRPGKRFNGSLKVYLALEPCHMRKNFNTLATLVRNPLQLAAHPYIRKDQIDATPVTPPLAPCLLPVELTRG